MTVTHTFIWYQVLTWGTVFLACFLIAHQNIDRWKVVSVLTVSVGWTTDTLSSEIVLLCQGNVIGI